MTNENTNQIDSSELAHSFKQMKVESSLGSALDEIVKHLYNMPVEDRRVAIEALGETVKDELTSIFE